MNLPKETVAKYEFDGFHFTLAKDEYDTMFIITTHGEGKFAYPILHNHVGNKTYSIAIGLCEDEILTTAGDAGQLFEEVNAYYKLKTELEKILTTDPANRKQYPMLKE